MFTSQKIFLGLLSGVFVLFLFYTSYVFDEHSKKFSAPEIKNISQKEYVIEKKDGSFKLESKSSSKESIKINYLNYNDEIISYGVKPKVVNKNVKFENGNFLVKIGSLSSNYNFSGKGFKFETKGVNSFYLDNSGKDIKIISLDNILKIDLIDLEKEKIANSVYIYPNEYIIFNPVRNKYAKGADIFRMTQLISLDFLNSPVLKNGKISEKWQKKIFFGEDEKKAKLVEMFIYLVREKEKDDRLFEQFKDEKVLSIAGVRFIENFYFLFLNPKKKKIYHKNVAIKDLIDISNLKLNDKKQEIVLKEKITNLAKQLDILKKLSKNDFSQMKEITLYYLSLFIEENKGKDSVLNVVKFINNLDGKNLKIIKNPFINLTEIFENYNYYQTNNIYENIGNFAEKYSNSGLKDEKGYFIYYLRKLILAAFQSLNDGENIKLSSLRNIINIYTKTSLNYYDEKIKENESKKKIIVETGIRTYNEMIRLLTRRIGKNYFESSLSDTGILIKKSNVPAITQRELYNLKNNINKMSDFIEKEEYQEILPDTILNKKIMAEHNSLKKLLGIYFEALENYDKYVATHEKKNQKFLSSKKIVENGITLETSYVREYLSKFNYLNIQNIEIKVKSAKYCYEPIPENDKEGDQYCYEIKNVIVNDKKKLDFLLFPFEENKIQNIKIENLTETFDDKDSTKGESSDINEGSYPLDFIEENFESYALKMDLDLDYTFKDFFYIVFVSKISYNVKENFEYSFEEDEDPFIRSVKNSLLLGEGGSLDILKNYLEIKYNDIILTEQDDDNYKIEIKDSVLKYGEYEGLFNSEYLFQNGETNSFKNPKIKFNDLLLGNTINFIGIFAVDGKNKKIHFETVLDNLTEKGVDKKVDLLTKIDELIVDLEDITGENEFKITYNYIIDSFTIRGSNIYIATKGSDLTKVKYNGKNILTKKDKIDNISSYFTN